MEAHSLLAKKKILSPDELKRSLALWQFKESRIVFTNGCFDILHRGHLEYLSQAALLGDVMIIGLNSDVSVRKIKGPSRPVQLQDSRALLLAMLPMVTAVVLFDEETPYQLIRLVRPDVLAKGGDYKEDEIVGADLVRESGGKVVVLPFVKGFSTSSIIQKAKE